MPSLLTLSDVMATGHHAALARQRRAGQDRRPSSATAPSASAASSPRSGSAPSRSSSSAATPTGSRSRREFGATDVVSERGDEAVERVRELTGGFGAHSVLECVGHELSMRRRSASPARAAPSVASACRRTSRSRRPGRRSSTTSPSAAAPPRSAPTSRSCCRTCSKAHRARPRLRPRPSASTDVPDGYRAMNDREAIKVMVKP